MGQNTGYPNNYTPKYLCLNLHDGQITVGQIKGLPYYMQFQSALLILFFQLKMNDLHSSAKHDITKNVSTAAAGRQFHIKEFFMT